MENRTNLEIMRELHGYWRWHEKPSVDDISKIIDLESLSKVEIKNIREMAMMYFRNELDRAIEKKDEPRYETALDCREKLLKKIDSLNDK
jgi:hypothetical protein